MENGTQRPDGGPDESAEVEGAEVEGPEVEGGKRRTGRLAGLVVVGAVVLAFVAVTVIARLASPVAAGNLDDTGRDVGLAACGAAETDPDGVQVDASGLGSEACVSSRSEDPDHSVIPLVCPQATLDEIVDVATSTLSGVDVESRSGEYVHLVGRTRLLGFTDDIELRTFGGVIDVRADARTPWADRGRARERIEQLRATLIERGTCAA